MSQIINSLYIHFPFCQHLCNYCDFYKIKLKDGAQVREFEKTLDKQWREALKLLEKEDCAIGELETLYIGGGTPSLWKDSGVKYLKSFFKNIKLKKDCEFTLEVDPGSWTKEEILAWQSIGVNRFSIGIQTYDKELLKVMDRVHSLEDVKDTLQLMRELEVNYSVDLMLGLPQGGGERNLQAELDQILLYGPTHFSVYILKARKNYVHFSKLPEDESVEKEYLFVSEYLESCGYEHYEISNFTKNKKYSKHNMKYWQYQSVGAIGTNATGLIVHPEKALRYQWKGQVVGMTTELLEGESLIIEKLFLGFRTYLGLNLQKLFPKIDTSILDGLVAVWNERGYLKEGSSREGVVLTPFGYLMCDSLIDDVFGRVEF